MCSVKKNLCKILCKRFFFGKDLGNPLVIPIWDNYQDNMNYESFWIEETKDKEFKMEAKKIAVISSVNSRQSTKYNRYIMSPLKQKNIKQSSNCSRNIELRILWAHPELLSLWFRQSNYWIKVLNLENIELYNGLIEYYHGHNGLYQGIIKYYHGHNELYQGIIKYYQGHNELSQGIIELYQIYNGLKKTRFQRIKRIMHRKRRKIRGGIDIDFSLSLRRITELNIEVQSIIEILMECKIYIKEYMVLLELKSVVGREVKTTQGCAILPGVAELQKHPRQIFIL